MKIPTVKVKLPKVTLPKVALPKVDLSKIKLPKIQSQKVSLILSKIKISKKTGITIAIVLGIAVLAIAGRKSPFEKDKTIDELLSKSNQLGDTSTLDLGSLDPSTQQVQQDDNAYTAFYFNVYDLIKNYYWNKLSDEQLINITRLAVNKVSGEDTEVVPANRDELRTLIIQKLDGKTEDEQKQFVVQIADVVLANLEPFGRSRLYTSKKQQELSNTVKNVDPNLDHYKTLGVDKEANPEQVADAYTSKITELSQKEQTPEVKQEEALVEKAKEVLGDTGNKNVYDQSGANPTIENRLISPRIAYIHITKFSPTTVEELNRVMQKYDAGNELDTLIIDIRGNIGGAIDGLPYFLGPFIGKDQYAYQFFKRGEKEDYITKTGWLPSLVRYKKVVVLTDNQVQSSAEVFAAVLKKYNVGVLVGTPTKGWGTVEAVFKITNQIDPDNETYSALLVHSLTLRDDNTPIEGKGVEPNINTNNPGWQQELYKYFNNQEIVNAVVNLLQ